ncbi:MAG: chloride channel protein [Chromatiales bacterium]|nr:chloride channel protein [Chromatiales bacterium]
MLQKQRLTNWFAERLDELRLHLSRPDALLQLSVFGLLSGLLAGGVITLFRMLVEGSQASFLPGGLAENYEALPLWLRVALPISGGLLIGLMFRFGAKGLYVLGVARVLERMAYHQGYLTVRGFVLQFFGAAIAIISGHSVGREGPHIYLGAASGSLLGQYLSLPNNSIRTLVGCGAAAGIAASFNTPLAGVIFALEVVMMEYTLASFIPVILAAAGATSVSVLAFGSAPAFVVPEHQFSSLSEIPLVLLLGLIVGAVAALFIHLLQWTAEIGKPLPFWWRTVLAGVLVGLVSLWVPQVMGIGYDTVNSALLGEMGLSLLVLILFAKLLATVACIGLGVPGGMIGPALFLGAVLGSAVALAVQWLMPSAEVDVGLYAMLGMGAMMGSSLQAPLAALTAMMELTHSPQIIMPGMLVIVIASLCASEIFRKESLFIAMLKANGMDYDTSPVMQTLRRSGVASVMSKLFARPERLISREQAEALLKQEPEWLLVQGEEQPMALLRAVDLAGYLQAQNGEDEALEEDPEMQVDLMKIPGQRFEVAPIPLQATLQEALEALDQQSAEALFVERMTAPGIKRIYGVLTRDQVESAYRY